MIAPDTNSGQWYAAIRKHRYQFVNKISRDGVVINPHKLHVADNKYYFAYRTLEQYEQDMRQACQILGISGYNLRRMDICLDVDKPYQQTQKITGLIMLALSEQLNLTNRYASVDPLTLTPKARTMMDGVGAGWKNAVEHYNRALKDQSAYGNEPVVNRLELRVQHCRGRTSATDVAQRWYERLGAAKSADYEGIEVKLNDVLQSRYEAMGACGANSLNQFILNNGGYFYSRRQIENFFSRFDNTNRTKNFMSNYGRYVQLYRPAAVRAEVDQMRIALDRMQGRIL